MKRLVSLHNYEFSEAWYIDCLIVFILYDAAHTYGKKLYWKEIHVEVTQSREITFHVKYVNTIVFAKISGGAVARFARSWLRPCIKT